MKKIIACCDGTWNRPEKTERGIPIWTNVELLYNFILPKDDSGIRQFKAYESGVGSSTFSLRDKVQGGATGLGIDKRIKDIYSFIVINYEPGDQIFLFGFSRGAYTARSVAGLIRNCGVLKKENIHLIDLAYGYYRDRNYYTTPRSDFMESFRDNYCSENTTPIEFIGVWDTVGSLGLPLWSAKIYNIERYKFHDVRLSGTVKNAFHAVAIDEHRYLFEPTLWEIDPMDAPFQNVEQRWFTGSHSNVGGGYPETKLSNISLKWMMEKAEVCGLKMLRPGECDMQRLKEIKLDKYNIEGSADGKLVNSRSIIYRLWFPVLRKIGITKSGRISDPEKITNESVDSSVIERIDNPEMKYNPRNLEQ